MKLIYDANFLFNLKGSIFHNINRMSDIDYIYSLYKVDSNYVEFAKSDITNEKIYLNMLNDKILNKMIKYCNLTYNKAT